MPFKERPQAKILINKIEEGIITEVTVEELSRLGRHTGDCITTLEWMDSKEVNVVVRNLGVQSRPNGKRNPIWNVLTSVISSLYALELENIKERTPVGRKIYVQRGGVLGRKIGTTLSDRDFIDKPKSQKILEYHKKDWTFREIAKQVEQQLIEQHARSLYPVKNVKLTPSLKHDLNALRRHDYMEGIKWEQENSKNLAEQVLADLRNKMGPVANLLALLQEDDEEHKDYIQERIKELIPQSEQAIEYLKGFDLNEFKNR